MVDQDNKPTKMQSHLTEWEVRQAVRDYVQKQYGVQANNIKFDATNGLVTYETH